MSIPGRPSSPADLFVAVTGHRSIVDPDLVAATAAQVRQVILDLYPRRHVVLLSALAEGADRLILAPWLDDAGTELVAMLPMPRSEYVADFHSEDSREEFARLIDRAAHVIELPHRDGNNAAYEAIGHALVSAAHVLVAVWDGEPPGGPGGTGAVVAESRRRGQPLAWIRVTRSMPSRVELVIEGLPADRRQEGVPAGARPQVER